MKHSPMLVSIIIVVKNDRGIDATLAHLDLQRSTTRSEVIVVDASEPTRLADIKAKYPWVIWNQFPVSTSRTTPQQRNRGLELAKGDVIAFIDANCVPSPNWLATIATLMKQGRHIVCGPVLDSSATNLVHYAPSLDTPRYVDDCTTISVGISRAVIDQIGGFDPSFSFGQDVDFFWRATDAGFKIYYHPEVSISHDWGKKSEQLRRAFDYGKARAHLFKKHWRTRRSQLLSESHVWFYPLLIVGLPLTIIIPVYPLLILVPIFKNRGTSPVGLLTHHLTYGMGVIAGTLKHWPQPKSHGFATAIPMSRRHALPNFYESLRLARTTRSKKR